MFFVAFLVNIEKVRISEVLFVLSHNWFDRP